MESTFETRTVAQDVLGYIEKNPQNHDQSNWFRAPGDHGVPSEANICNTTMCVAGTAVFLNYGIKALIDPHSELGEGWQEAGARMLGLDYEESEWLFYQTENDEAVDALRAIANGDQEKFDAVMVASYDRIELDD